jgi:glycosyltransferase involved in cell wall biosynthesis
VNGLLAEPGDAAALAEKISFLLQNPENARRMGSEAARTVEEKFDARLMTKRITDLYYRCASR